MIVGSATGAEAAMAHLEAKIDGENKRFSLAADGATHIGRSDNNDLVLSGDRTSRRHAMVQRSVDGSYYVIDLGSRNGTFVNGTRISRPVDLRPGDQICIGDAEFTFYQDVHIEYPSADPQELNSTNVVFAQSLITVLVADIRDFTGLSRRVDAVTLSDVASSLFREAGKVLHDHGAWAQKYIGDAVMAVWLHRRDEPEVSDLIAVLEALSRLAEIAGGLQDHFDLAAPVRFGAAMNTGWASVGNAGSIAAADYTALGETVNRTFRLESSTKEISRDFAIGQDTYDFLKLAAPVDAHLTPVTVRLKGYDEPATAYALNLQSLPGLISCLRS